MADINQIISLGIGSPASIEHFILVGLSAGTASVVEFDHACERTLISLDARHSLRSLDPVRTLVSLDPRRTLRCLED